MGRKPVVSPELERSIRLMKPREHLYELIKREMQLRNRWKIAPRGLPFRAGQDARRVGKKLNN